jgi:hypothetical protein
MEMRSQKILEKLVIRGVYFGPFTSFSIKSIKWDSAPRFYGISVINEKIKTLYFYPSPVTQRYLEGNVILIFEKKSKGFVKYIIPRDGLSMFIIFLLPNPTMVSGNTGNDNTRKPSRKIQQPLRRNQGPQMSLFHDVQAIAFLKLMDNTANHVTGKDNPEFLKHMIAHIFERKRQSFFHEELEPLNEYVKIVFVKSSHFLFVDSFSDMPTAAN